MRSRGLMLLCSCLALVALPGSAAAGAKGAKRTRDTVAPSIVVSVPTTGASITGTVTVAGSASDNTGVSQVQVSVDGGSYQAATGTSQWSRALDTSAYADGSHVITARATDAAGNATAATVQVQVSNVPAPRPPPPSPPSDSTAPSVTIGYPSDGMTVSGTIAVSGQASDNAALAKVEVSVDGGSYSSASGTDTWRFTLDTTKLADGSHTISARATDTSGNASSTSRAVTVKNSTSTPGIVEQLVTPEGATIQIYSDVAGWTAQGVYDMLGRNALDLARLGPGLTVKVQATYPSSTSSGVAETGGVYSDYRATIYLNGGPSTTFSERPEYVIAHEYGHAWTTYHLYMSQSGSWSAWLSARSLMGDPRVDSTYNWSKNEMIADDYRMLFGTPAAISGAAYINPDAPDPRNVPGLRDFFLTSWAK